MADQGMLSLFGEDAGLFSDGLDVLGDFPQQPTPAQSNPLGQQTNTSLNHEHQGNRGYHQGMIHSAGPGQPNQGPPNVNMNGMGSHYHNNPTNSSNPHHGYSGDAGGAGGGGGVWGQQQQSRSTYQQPPTQPGGGPNQIGGYQLSQGNYGGMQGPPAPTARMNQHYPPQSVAHPPAQEPSHYLGHVGIGGTQLRHPQSQPQTYPNMGHTPRYPHSPSRQPPHPHQHQQAMGCFGSTQYPGYHAQYGAVGSGMGHGANANININTNTSQAMGPGQLGQRFNQGSGTATGQQSQRYPPGLPHQPQPHQTHSAQMQQQGQPMHPLNHPQNLPQPQNQPQSHLAPPTQGSYPPPSSMSPMRVLGTPTPPPQQGRPPSAGLAGPPEIAGYTTLQSPSNTTLGPTRLQLQQQQGNHRTVTGRGMVDGSATLVEKKKQKKKPKEKAEVKEPKEPKSPKRPKTPKEPTEPKEKKTKSSMPKKVKLKVNIICSNLNSLLGDLLMFLIPSSLFPSVAKSDNNGQIVPAVAGASDSNELLYWPAASALTARLRRLITAYQRSNRREQLRQEALNRPDGRRRRRREFLNLIMFVISSLRWTRREEADFYRIVSTFGVVVDTQYQKFDWTQFRAFARLDKKTDESLEKYYYSFIAMCKRVCRMQIKTETELPDPTFIIDPITEERASRTLYRIELLRRIREQVLPHPLLAERLKLCQPSPDLPEWWECGRHDHDLLLGASKHGVSRTDYHILNDPTFAFLEAHQRFTSQLSSGIYTGGQGEILKVGLGVAETTTAPILTPTERMETTELPQHPDLKAQPGHKATNEEEKENPGLPQSPKSDDTEKCPADEDEERVDEDDKSEKSSQAEVIAVEQKNYDEESIASVSTSAQNETRDGFCPDDVPETSFQHALQERTFGFSFWPKDRVMINRMDNICEAILKGKWPVNRRHIIDFPGSLLSGHSTMVPAATVATVAESPLQRHSLTELTKASMHTNYSGSEEKMLSLQVHEDALRLTVPRQRRRRRKKIEIEAERAAKRRNLMEMVAQLRESHAASESQSHAIDLTKVLASECIKFASPPLPGFPSSLVTSPSLKAHMELLRQAPRSGLRANGSLEADLPVMRRRRGRRKNVEGLELLFKGNNKAGGVWRVIIRCEFKRYKCLHQIRFSVFCVLCCLGGLLSLSLPATHLDFVSPLQKSNDLLLSQFSKPKQKRHRCRNPSKIDINTLTGEERVPVVNRRNGRKMGGAMAPPMKELPRWLLDNPEFSVAPDWTDIVKQSGFLPEAMFDRLLTGPVVREEGVRRRGRRPKSEIAKAAAAAQASSLFCINPLLLNSLFGGMDLSSLQSLQSLHLAAGLLSFPPPTDPKQAAASTAAASMLPLMLPSMGALPNMAAALPNMFGLGGLVGDEEEENEAEGHEGVVKKVRKMEAGGEEAANKVKKPINDVTAALQIPATDLSAEASINGDAVALLTAAGMTANSLAFNPFLLSTMAPGLLYPSMFLPPGLSGLSLSGFPTASTLAELQSAMAGALAGNVVTTNLPGEEKNDGAPREEEEEEEEEESDMAEEKEDGAKETRGEDRGLAGEEEEMVPLKDMSD
uniref:BRK domain-containing protein n=1 Tax=Mola mola TaxID=94237 RepID=A0A3Q3XRT5_MOLML